MLRQAIPALVAAALAFHTATLSSQEPGAPPINGLSREPVPRLLSQDRDESKAARDEIVQQHDELVHDLIGRINDPRNHVPNPDPVEMAMDVLGELRAPEAVPALVRYLAFPMVRDPRAGEFPLAGGVGTFNRPEEEMYAAVRALIKIGEPSVGPVIKKLQTADGAHEERAGVAVLVRLSESLPIRQRLLEALAKAAAEPREAARLQRVLQRFDEEIALRLDSPPQPPSDLLSDPAVLARLLQGRQQRNEPRNPILQQREQLVREREQLVGELVQLVENQMNRVERPYSVRMAMDILGEFRAPEAVDALVAHVAFPALPSQRVEKPVTIELGEGYVATYDELMRVRGWRADEHDYPGIEPLVKIGLPSLGPVIKKLATTENPHEQRALVVVLVRLSPALPARERLVDAAIKAAEPPQEQRLKQALKRFDQEVARRIQSTPRS